MAEMLQDGGLGECSFGTEESGLERFFLSQAGRHKFSEHADDLFVPQRPFVSLDDVPQYLRFSLRPIEIDGLSQTFRRSHIPGATSPSGDQCLNLGIDFVDSLP
jgi:hypothetical protein